MTAFTETMYIESATGLLDRLDKICLIIAALEDRLIIIAGGDTMEVEEYTIDDGQTKIQTKYKSFTELTSAIKNFTTIKEILLNKLNGRGFVLRPWQALR